jgi:hypothetical protein
MLYLSGVIFFAMGWIIVKLLVRFNIFKKRDESGNNTNEKDDACNLA